MIAAGAAQFCYSLLRSGQHELSPRRELMVENSVHGTAYTPISGSNGSLHDLFSSVDSMGVPVKITVYYECWLGGSFMTLRIGMKERNPRRIWSESMRIPRVLFVGLSD